MLSVENGHMFLTTRFEEALVFASRLHVHQVRKGTAIPYISHLLAVAGLVLEHGADEDTAIAALLHDAVDHLRSGWRERIAVGSVVHVHLSRRALHLLWRRDRPGRQARPGLLQDLPVGREPLES